MKAPSLLCSVQPPERGPRVPDAAWVPLGKVNKVGIDLNKRHSGEDGDDDGAEAGDDI